MAESMNAPQSGSGPVSVGSTRNGAVGIGPLPASLGQRDNQPQAQYCGPYRLEKTLGKGQTGIKHLQVVIFYICIQFHILPQITRIYIDSLSALRICFDFSLLWELLKSTSGVAFLLHIFARRHFALARIAAFRSMHHFSTMSHLIILFLATRPIYIIAIIRLERAHTHISVRLT